METTIMGCIGFIATLKEYIIGGISGQWKGKPKLLSYLRPRGGRKLRSGCKLKHENFHDAAERERPPRAQGQLPT